MLRRFEQYLTDQDWHGVQAGVEVKLVAGPDGDETFILARSADRREKEKAMHERFIDRMDGALKKMQASAASGRLKDLAVGPGHPLFGLGGQWRRSPKSEMEEPICLGKTTSQSIRTSVTGRCA